MENPFDLRHQTALVTGGSSGIGYATALRLAAANAAVVINHLPKEKDAADAAVEKIAACGGQAMAIAADVSDEAQVEEMYTKAVERFGSLHILVNNAGIPGDSAFEDMSLDEWSRVLDVNLTGQFLCARAAIRIFLSRGMQPEISRALGKIICISSVHQRIPWALHANYVASKGGVTLLMQTLAQEFADRKIRLNGIAPGAIRTPVNKSVWEDENQLAELMKRIPYDRIGEPEDIANTVLWLASDMSDYITGATIYVDGGMSLYPSFQSGG